MTVIFIIILIISLLITLLMLFDFNFYTIIPTDQYPDKILNKPIAHRGLFTKTKPENTLAAFENAIKNKMAVELDVNVTNDNVPIIVHDNDLTRLTGTNIQVTKSCFNDLKNLKINHQAHIPTLDQVLKLINHKIQIIVEIKDYGLTKNQRLAIMRQLTAYNGEITIQSFNPILMYWIRKNYPNFIRGQLFDQPNFNNKLLFNLRHNLFTFLSRPSYICYNKETIIKANLNPARQKGLKTIGFTFKNKDIKSSLAKNYFDNVIVELE